MRTFVAYKKEKDGYEYVFSITREEKAKAKYIVRVERIKRSKSKDNLAQLGFCPNNYGKEIVKKEIVFERKSNFYCSAKDYLRKADDNFEAGRALDYSPNRVIENHPELIEEYYQNRFSLGNPYGGKYSQWTEKEVNTLIEMYYSGKEIRNIAFSLGKTVTAVRSKLQRMGLNE